MYLSMLSLLSLAGFALLASAAAVRDIRTLTIPNGLILTLLAGYLLVAAAAGWTRDEITTSLIAAAMMLFAGLMVNAMGWFPQHKGAQMAKFAAVCCLWLGAPQALPLIGLSALIAVFMTALLFCVYTVMPAEPSDISLDTAPGASHPHVNRPLPAIPAGYAIAAAALLLLPSSPWVMSVI